MNARGLVVLAALAVLSVVATAAVLRTAAPTIASDRRGEFVVPGLADKAGDISGFAVRQETDSITVERSDSGFAAADSGFPVKTEVVRDLLASVSDLRFEEARTSDPTRYGDLGLADPGAANAGKEITIRTARGELADVVVGNRDSSIGGPTGGMYVRLKGQPQTWLARGNVRLPSSKADWFAAVDLGVKGNQIVSVELSGGGLEKVEAKANTEKPGELTLQEVPEKRVADSAKVGRMVSFVEHFSFQDVRKRTKTSDDVRHMMVDLADGLRLVITTTGELADGWVQLSAQAINDAARDKASALGANVDRFDFRLSGNQAEILRWTLADLTSEQRS